MGEVTYVPNPYTVSAKIPPEWKEKLYEAVIGPDKEYASISEYVRDLIREDMKRRGLFNKTRREEDEGKN